MMEKRPPAANPDAYVRALRGWKRGCVEALREAVTGAATLDEQIKWGHLVYSSGGPVLLIRAEEERVLFGFWRGQLLSRVEPRLKPGGKYEMATQVFNRGDEPDAAIALRLVRDAVALNRRLGDPTKLAKG
ncbi:MAG: DUF1801 domain-containing protein [Hyphomonadaceae bacterium]